MVYCQKNLLKQSINKSRNEENIKSVSGPLDMSPPIYKFAGIKKKLPGDYPIVKENDRDGITKYNIDDKRPILKTRVGPSIGYNNKSSPLWSMNSEVSFIRDIVPATSFKQMPMRII